jgi:hypothetical protein
MRPACSATPLTAIRCLSATSKSRATAKVPNPSPSRFGFPPPRAASPAASRCATSIPIRLWC